MDKFSTPLSRNRNTDRAESKPNKAQGPTNKLHLNQLNEHNSSHCLTLRKAGLTHSKSSTFRLSSVKKTLQTTSAENKPLKTKTHRAYSKFNLIKGSNYRIATQSARKVDKRKSSLDMEELKRVKRKVCNLITNDTLAICDKFKDLNANFNNKFLSHISGEYYFEKVRKSQRNMHYHANDLGEGHDKYSMIIDAEKLNRGLLLPHQALKAKLTKKELRLINKNPEFFIRNKELLKKMAFGKESLVDTLNSEEKPHKVKRRSGHAFGLKSNKSFESISMKDQKPKIERDLRFNWTQFDKKIAIALNTLNTKVNKSRSVKNMHQTPKQIELPIDLRQRINCALNNAQSLGKRPNKLMINFNQKLSSNQLRECLNYELFKRVSNEMNIYHQRQQYLNQKKHDEYIHKKALNQIRDNIIETNKHIKPKQIK